MELGRLVLRAAVGGTFIVHGTQKLYGAFGGGGPEGTGRFFESLGLRPGERNAVAAGWTETACGSMLVAGLMTPIAAAGATAAMITALRTTAWKDGVQIGTGELETLLATAALSLADTGPGPLSLDRALGRDRGGPVAMLLALAAGAAASTAAIAAGRQQAVAAEQGGSPS